MNNWRNHKELENIFLKEYREKINLNEIFKASFPLKKYPDIKIDNRDLVQELNSGEIIQKINVNLFDVRFYKRDKIELVKSKNEAQHHFEDGKNKGLFIAFESFHQVKFCVNTSIFNKSTFSRQDKLFVYPLYLYTEKTLQHHFTLVNDRIPNFKKEFLDVLESRIQLPFKSEYPKGLRYKEGIGLKFYTPIEVLEYIVGELTLYNNNKEEVIFLPDNLEEFNQIRKLGQEIMGVFLMENRGQKKYVSQFSEEGTNVLDVIRTEEDEKEMLKIFINETQFFAHVPIQVWEFVFWGNKPVQSWLAERIGKTLRFDEIIYFHKIILSIQEIRSFF